MGGAKGWKLPSHSKFPYSRGIMAGRSISDPIWTVTFDPIQSSAADRPQHLHIIGEEG
jgi:hypothetical protein